MSAVLHVVMYHYVRDLPNSQFPRLKGMLTSTFRQQLCTLKTHYELATLESAMAFLQGAYAPKRDLCLLTFDDGVKEHYTEITPLLVEHGIQGIFFLITSCLQEQRVVSVHMNHVLMAMLDFPEYQQAFFQRLNTVDTLPRSLGQIDPQVAQRTYRWDTPDVAVFKYFFNFALAPAVRDQVVRSLFTDYIGPEESFAPSWYVSWDEARAMQDAGMVLGGHSHQHQPLATLASETLAWDIQTCQRLLYAKLHSQAYWPFSYPYGKASTFNRQTMNHLRTTGVACAFCTEVGSNDLTSDLFAIRRIDCKDAPGGRP